MELFLRVFLQNTLSYHTVYDVGFGLLISPYFLATALTLQRTEEGKHSSSIVVAAEALAAKWGVGRKQYKLTASEDSVSKDCSVISFDLGIKTCLCPLGPELK